VYQMPSNRICCVMDSVLTLIAASRGSGQIKKYKIGMDKGCP